ncbi:hypothetical protein MTO96_026476 [Rhipicephalus appendiculatus]
MWTQCGPTTTAVVPHAASGTRRLCVCSTATRMYTCPEGRPKRAIENALVRRVKRRWNNSSSYNWPTRDHTQSMRHASPAWPTRHSDEDVLAYEALSVRRIQINEHPQPKKPGDDTVPETEGGSPASVQHNHYRFAAFHDGRCYGDVSFDTAQRNVTQSKHSTLVWYSPVPRRTRRHTHWSGNKSTSEARTRGKVRSDWQRLVTSESQQKPARNESLVLHQERNLRAVVRSGRVVPYIDTSVSPTKETHGCCSSNQSCYRHPSPCLAEQRGPQTAGVKTQMRPPVKRAAAEQNAENNGGPGQRNVLSRPLVLFYCPNLHAQIKRRRPSQGESFRFGDVREAARAGATDVVPQFFGGDCQDAPAQWLRCRESLEREPKAAGQKERHAAVSRQGPPEEGWHNTQTNRDEVTEPGDTNRLEFNVAR